MLLYHYLPTLPGLLIGQQAKPPKETLDQILSPDEKDLYNKIVKDVLGFYAERLEHPDPNLAPLPAHHSQECALIFRQTRSWRRVEKMLEEIVSTDEKTKQWVNDWLQRIQEMRTLQKDRKTYLKWLQEYNKKSNHATLGEDIRIAASKVKKKIPTLRKQILTHLEQGEKCISQNEDREHILSKIDPTCEKVAKYMRDHWPYLRVFLDWPEISLDDEKMAVKVQGIKNATEQVPFQNLVNSITNSSRSIKAIFLIQQTDQNESEVIYENVEPGKIIRTTRVGLKEKYVEPSLKRNSSSSLKILEDAFIYNCDFVQIEEDPALKINQIATKLERVVVTALNKINSKLIQANSNPLNLDEEHPEIEPYSFTRWWFFWRS